MEISKKKRKYKEELYTQSVNALILSEEVRVFFFSLGKLIGSM